MRIELVFTMESIVTTDIIFITALMVDKSYFLANLCYGNT